MTRSPATVDLSGLDAGRPASDVTSVWAENLSALAREQPGRADQLRQVVLPEAWRPVLALDDSITYRLEAPGEPPVWLGGTAAPRTRAAGLLDHFSPSGKNPALPCIGTGAELRDLLDRLPANLAVFVFEADLRAVAAVLRTQDFSAEIGRGRCIFVPSDHEAEFLNELLVTYPGLQPPGNILLPDLVSAARLEEIRVICEQVHNETFQRRARRLAELADATRPVAAEPRLALLALTPDSAAHSVVADLARAAGTLGWPLLRCTGADPRSDHPLVHCEALAEFAPSLTICVNHPRAVLPVTPPGAVCVWHHHEANVPDVLPDDGTIHLAASPRVLSALRRVAARSEAVLEWYWACDASVETVDADQSPEAENDTTGPTIILVGDLLSQQPEIYGVKQVSYRRLWGQLLRTASQVWETPRALHPEKMLVLAERACEVELTDDSQREMLVRLIERVVIPATVIERIAHALANQPFRVLALGYGWERAEAQNIEARGADLSALPDRGVRFRPRACVFAGRVDPLSSTLLEAAARGWPLLVHDLGGQSLVSGLSDVIRAGQHFESFSDLAGLLRALKLLREMPPSVQRRTERAREYVRAVHSYERRLQDLVALVQKHGGQEPPLNAYHGQLSQSQTLFRSRCTATLTGRTAARLLGAGVLLVACAAAGAAEQAFTMLSDFEDPSVAARITSVRNAVPGDCSVRLVSIPARGRGSLAVQIGATAEDVSVACDLVFREATRLAQADRVATYYWLKTGEMEVAFRVRDAAGQTFETASKRASRHRRWTLLDADLSPDQLKCVHGNGPLVYPLEIQGYRVTTKRLGEQTIQLDELQVKHRVEPRDLISGEFRFDEPTRIYEPGSPVRAAIVLENRSRTRALEMSVDLAWMQPDGSVLRTHSARVRLQAGGGDYRSYQQLDFSQIINDPGLYRLVARVRAPGWTVPNTFATSIAVTFSNRRLSPGRSTFFALQSNLLREPELDQMLEVSVARDIGANLLALTVPWYRIEPKPGVIEFAALEKVVDAVTEKDVAAMLVLTGPPHWLPADATSRPARIEKLIDALAARFGRRLQWIRLEAPVLGQLTLTQQLEAVAAIRADLVERHPEIAILPPPILVDDQQQAAQVAAFAQAHPGVPLVFQTSGLPADRLHGLEEFRHRGRFEWRPIDWWLHEAQPLIGSGCYCDAEAVLHCYIRAAAAGVAGLMWSDLRDDDNDPTRPAALRGLVRRDFSPKASLLGYSAAAGRLTGYRYAGPVSDAPEAYDSALFIGGDRQVAVLIPHANRILPAVLAPRRAALGELEVQDFERRPLALLESSLPPLLVTIRRPLFVTLTLKQANANPRLGLAQPWLRVPATVFCGSETEFAIELHADVPLRRSYLQLQMPKDAPFEASLSAMALRAAAGETTRQVVRLTPVQPAESFERAELTLRISLEGDLLEVPLEVRSLTDILPLSPGDRVLEPAYRVAEPAVTDGQRASASATLQCAYTRDALHLALTVKDDRLVPYRPAEDEEGGGSGDRLLLGVALEGGSSHAEALLEPAAEQAIFTPVHGTTPDQVRDWSCAASGAGPEGIRTYDIEIPAAALGRGRFRRRESPPDSRSLRG